MQGLIVFFSDTNNLAVISTVLFLLSEGLSLIPSIAANGVFQFIKNLIVKGKDKFPKK